MKNKIDNIDMKIQKIDEFVTLNEANASVGALKPKTRDELIRLIEERIKEEGPNCDLNDIDVSLITDMSNLFRDSEFNGDISKWTVSSVESMTFMFCGSKFNGDISNWDVSNVKEYYGFAFGCPIYGSEKMPKFKTKIKIDQSNKKYIPKFKPLDWKKTLKNFNSEFSNYSQLNGIESYIENGEIDEDCMNEWIEGMIGGGVDESKSDILADIFQFIISYYQCGTWSWVDESEEIVEKYKNLKSCEWVVEEEDYVTFMTLIKPLTPSLCAYGDVLAAKGQTDDFEDLIGFYENEE